MHLTTEPAATTSGALPHGWRPASSDDDSTLIGVRRGLDVVSRARAGKRDFREQLHEHGVPLDDEQHRRWWPAADRPSARDIAQSVLRA